MDNKDKSSQFKFIEEKISPKNNDKITKRKIGITIFFAAVFGLVASLVFVLCSNGLDYLVKKDQKDDSVVIAEDNTQTDSEDAENDSSKNSSEIYQSMMTQMSTVSKAMSDAIVTVQDISQGVDWLSNPQENTNSMYGVALHKDDKKIWFMTNYYTINDQKNMANNNQNDSNENKSTGDPTKVYRITFSDKAIANAELCSYDTELGIAVLSVNKISIPESTYENLKVVEFGLSETLQSGSPVIAVGSPNGRVNSMDMGFVTGQGVMESITDNRLQLYYTNMMSISEGEGVIVNLSGKVVGIITHIYDNTLNAKSCVFMGVSDLKLRINQLMQKELASYFGMNGIDMTKEYKDKIKIDQGVYITKINSSSPAFNAGLVAGDIILEVNGHKINSMSMFYDIISEIPIGREVKVVVSRSAGDTRSNVETYVKIGAR